MSFNDTKTVITPEQVAVTYTLAGIGTRFGAVVVDTLAQVSTLGLLILALVVLTPDLDWDRLSALERMVPSWLLAAFIIVFFAIIWGYFIFWETVWSGRTPGKRMAGIRVLRDDGYPIDFRAAFVRNIVRYVDFLPFAYGVGAVVVFLSADSKRLGDYAAGTVVVVDAKRAPRMPETQSASGGGALLGDPALLNLRALSREQFGVIERFVARRGELPGGVRAALAKRIAEPLFPVIGMEMPADPGFPYDLFLVELVSAYRGLSER